MEALQLERSSASLCWQELITLAKSSWGGDTTEQHLPQDMCTPSLFLPASPHAARQRGSTSRRVQTNIQSLSQGGGAALAQDLGALEDAAAAWWGYRGETGQLRA